MEGDNFGLLSPSFLLLHTTDELVFKVRELLLVVPQREKEGGVGPEKPGQESCNSSGNRHRRALMRSSKENDSTRIVDDFTRVVPMLT